MGNDEVQTVKEDVAEIKADVKEIFTMLNDVRIRLAGDYATRQELKEHEERERTGRRWWATWILVAASALAAIIRTIKF